jgi:hypothetical protein
MGDSIGGMAGLGKPAPVSGYRMGLISLLAAAIGSFAGLIAYVLYDLIGLSPISRFTTIGPFISAAPNIRRLVRG